ncbi:MAG: hypothetical protein ACR2ND_00610 [Solirubrobacteraceae bacterium]
MSAEEPAPGSLAEHSLAHRTSQREPYWPAQLTVLAALLLQVALPARLTIGPSWLIPTFEGLLLLGLVFGMPHRHQDERPSRRAVAVFMIALVNLTNAVSLALLAHYLLRHGTPNGHELIISGSTIWLTNVLIFSLWYWEIDRGGPGKRARDGGGRADFLFSQMGDGLPYAPKDWRPGFVDYLFLSLTTATALSPTDTLPLSPLAKALMGVQSLVSLVTIGLIVSRAVNILS